MARDSYRAALERIAMGISGREKSGLLPNEIRVHTTGMAKPDWELAEELLALVPPAGPSERDKQDAERYRWLRVRPSFIGWDWWNPPVPKEVVISPEFMDAAIDAAINRTPATTRPIEKEKPCS